MLEGSGLGISRKKESLQLRTFFFLSVREK